MDRDELAEIEARANAATPGPWTTHVVYRVITPRAGDDGYLVADCGASESPDCCEGNAPFIAHARTDVPALVAEVRRLAAEVERLSAMVPRWAYTHRGRMWRLYCCGVRLLDSGLSAFPGELVLDTTTGDEYPDLATACAAVCARLGLHDIKPPTENP